MYLVDLVGLEFFGLFGVFGDFWDSGHFLGIWVPGHFSGFLARSWVSGGGGGQGQEPPRGGSQFRIFWPPGGRIPGFRQDRRIRGSGGPGVRGSGGPGVRGSWGPGGARSGRKGTDPVGVASVVSGRPRSDSGSNPKLK